MGRRRSAHRGSNVSRDEALWVATSGDVLRRAATGDDAAIAVVFRVHQPRLLRFLRSLGPAYAEDVAQQVWLEVARALPRFEGDAEDFRRVLYTIARRRMIDAFRASGRRLDDPAGDDLPEATAPDGPEVHLDRVAWAEAVLRRLPASQAEVVVLRVIEGFSVDEVAEMTGRSPGSVRVLAHRGLHAITRLLRAGADAEASDVAEHDAGDVTQPWDGSMKVMR
jgi:RNA polymerase sigma-70 factor (ECF subfamily)